MAKLARRTDASKYYAVRTCIDGVWFASKKEARRYGELRLLEKAGEIHGLYCQPRFALKVHGAHVATYVGDFGYCECKKPECDGNYSVIEDVKGVLTPVYKLKKKLMLAIHGIEIREP